MLSILNTVLLWHAPSGSQWLIILVIALLLFGGKKIPELAKGLGRGIREFNDAKDGLKSEIEKGINSDTKATPSNKEEEK